MNHWKQNALAKVHKKRREVAERVKKEFVQTGDAEKMIDKVHKKGKATIKIKDLPF